MNFVYFRLHFIYPSGKPMAPHSLCCQEFAVDDYSLTSAELSRCPSLDASKLGHPRLSLI